MKSRALLFLFLVMAALPALAADDKIYRCGNEYTNHPPKGATNCKVVEGGAITIIHNTPVSARPSSASSDVVSAPGQRIDTTDQRQRDADARVILEDELKRAEAKQTELLAAYNNGQPDKIGGEAQNYQKYLDRVAEMKASIDRNQSDIDGIKRELARFK